MASKIAYHDTPVKVELDLGAAVAADQVVFKGSLKVYTLEATDSNNKATCALPGCQMVVKLTCTAKVAAANSAIAVGDAIYLDTGETPDEYNKDSTNGTLIGYALGTVTSGSSGEIPVAI